MKLERIWCDSRVVRSIGYDPVNQLLEVEVRGRTYRKLEQYLGPEPNVAIGFIAAPSKAAFYYLHVVPKFPVQHVDRDHGVFLTPAWKSNEKQIKHQAEVAAWGFGP